MQLEGSNDLCTKFRDVAYEACSGTKSEIMSNETEGKCLNLVGYDDDDAEPSYLTFPSEGNGLSSQWLSSVNSFSTDNSLMHGMQSSNSQRFPVKSR